MGQAAPSCPEAHSSPPAQLPRQELTLVGHLSLSSPPWEGRVPIPMAQMRK